MNVILNTPLNITLTSALLVQEGEGVGTLQFQIMEQPVTLVFTSTDYTYDTPFSVGDRVRLTQAFSYFGVGSEGVLQAIIIDPTDDKADVFFDTIYPDQNFQTDRDTIDVLSADISLKFRVPLNFLEII
jgi:hypothetical protein